MRVLAPRGFLVRWPTMLTPAMFPVFAVMYVRLAFAEEHDVRKRCGDAYERHAMQVPRFTPRAGA